MKRGEGGRQMERKGGGGGDKGKQEGVRRGEQSETGISGSEVLLA